MEDTGTEPAHEHHAVLQAADGGAGRVSDLAGHMVHRVLLSHMAGCADALRLVGIADVAVGKGPASAYEVGGADAGARGAVAGI